MLSFAIFVVSSRIVTAIFGLLWVLCCGYLVMHRRQTKYTGSTHDAYLKIGGGDVVHRGEASQEALLSPTLSWKKCLAVIGAYEKVYSTNPEPQTSDATLVGSPNSAFVEIVDFV